MKRICLQCRSRRRRRFNPSQSILILTPELILSTLRYWFSLPTGKEGLGRWPLPFHRVSSLKMGLERWGLIVSWHCLFSPSLLVVIIHVCSFTKSCPALCNPMDWSPPGSPQFSSVQSLSRVWLFAIPWTAARQASLSITNSRSLLKLMSIESVMSSNHLILCCPLLLLPSIFPSIRIFSNESVPCIGWPRYWSFSFSISPSHEYSGLISFRMDWLDLLVAQGTLRVSSNTTVQKHQFFGIQPKLPCPSDYLAGILEWNSSSRESIFPTQGSKLHLLQHLHWEADSLPPSHLGNPLVVRAGPRFVWELKISLGPPAGCVALWNVESGHAIVEAGDVWTVLVDCSSLLPLYQLPLYCHMEYLPLFRKSAWCCMDKQINWALTWFSSMVATAIALVDKFYLYSTWTVFKVLSNTFSDFYLNHSPLR